MNQIMPAPLSTLHNYEVDWLDDNPKSFQLFNTREIPEGRSKPGKRRRKDNKGWGDYLEAGNVRQFDEKNDETFDFVKNFN